MVLMALRRSSTGVFHKLPCLCLQSPAVTAADNEERATTLTPAELWLWEQRPDTAALTEECGDQTGLFLAFRDCLLAADRQFVPVLVGELH